MNVLIIDDHALIREGIALMVKMILPETGIWLAGSYGAGMEIANRVNIDFTFLDLQLPDESGFAALERLKQQHACMAVVVVSAFEDRATVIRALEMGAKAFVPKSANSEHMKNVIKDLFAGRVYLPESMVGTTLEHAGRAHGGMPEEWNLTDRQKEVLALLVLGLSNKLIARKLDIVESTVKIHVSAILRELKVATRTQAMVAVARQGIRLPIC